ncbi:MAG: hypothetical protein JWO93_952 [Micrococcaceae bacterium]|nr:hypothetical protein [Micrococcaceae bacterium]
MASHVPSASTLTLVPPAAGNFSAPIGNETADGLRMQVLGIISSVLSSPDEAGADNRARLRRRLTQHPGRPEQALLEHMLLSRMRGDVA